MSKTQAYIIDSVGQIVQMQAPLMLSAGLAAAEQQEFLKTATDPTAGSRKLRTKYGTVVDGVTCAPRPFDFALYAYSLTLNTYHARATRAKAKDIAGRPWHIEGEGQDALKQRVTEFFRRAFGRDTFGRGMGRVWSDYEALGNGFLEVIPTLRGDEPAGLAHIPATQMWVRLDQMGFVQQLGAEVAHYRDYGVPDEAYAALPATDPLSNDNATTSIVHFSQYNAWSPYYGIPSIMPAWSALCMMTLINEYNLRFFANNAVPDYVVTVEGDTAEGTVDTIREYFRTHIQGQAHKTLILEAPSGGGKITFQALQANNKEGAFRLMRTDCRDEILAAHGVPPQKVGVVETGKLGGNLASEQITEYKNSIVTPGQEDLATGLTDILIRGFAADGLSFAFDPYDIADQAMNATIDSAYLDRNVVTPNEIRRVRFPELDPLPGGDEPLKPATLGDLAGIEQAVTEVQQLARKAVEK